MTSRKEAGNISSSDSELSAYGLTLLLGLQPYFQDHCKEFEKLYGTTAVKPNMHLHGHLKECLLDYGPMYGFWCFSFERYNGLLGSFKTNHRAPEIQIMRKFIVLSFCYDFAAPKSYNITRNNRHRPLGIN
jgi:hypothetical protein